MARVKAEPTGNAHPTSRWVRPKTDHVRHILDPLAKTTLCGMFPRRDWVGDPGKTRLACENCSNLEDAL